MVNKVMSFVMLLIFQKQGKQRQILKAQHSKAEIKIWHVQQNIILILNRDRPPWKV